MSTRNLREEVLLLLVDIDRKKVMSSQGLSDLLFLHQFDQKKDRAFMTRLFEGTLEMQLYLDYVLDQFSNKGMEKQKPFIRCLLRMFLYQILFMDQVGDFAACNEAVKLAKKKGFGNLSGFVNGILRNIARQKDVLPLPDEQKEPYRYLSVRYSIPVWILNYWGESWPYETVKAMAEASLSHMDTSLRVNLSKGDVCTVRQSLIKDGASVSDGAFLPYLLKIRGYDSLDKLAAFRQGAVIVQDESSALVAHIADPPGDGLVVDVCSAPGGKSIHLADIIKQKHGRGTVIARDVSGRKIALVEENIKRCGFDNIRTELFDGRMADETLKGKADVVLADVPCSGLGILAKKNDIKYNASPEKIRELVSLQRQIVKNATFYVKPGGSLVFSTCTVSEEENEKNRDWILKNLPFEPEDFLAAVPERLKNAYRGGALTLLPGIHGGDGFYIAKFRKNSDTGTAG